MAETRSPADRAGKGRTDNDMDQGLYKRPSNPLAEDDPRRDGNQTRGPYRHAPPPSENLLQRTGNPPPDLGTRSLVYDTRPWKGEFLLAGIEIFFQKNTYHPFATCGNPDCGRTGPISMSTITKSTISD